MTFQNITNNSSSTTQANENFDAVAAAGTYGKRAPAVAGLTWAYYGGRGFGNTIADGTATLTASTTNYVVANRTTGAVSVATTTTNWNDTTNYYRLYLIVTGSATITTATDYREFTGGAAPGSGMSNPMTTAGDLIYGGTPSSGVAPPTRLAATTNGYVLTLAAGVPTWAAATGGFSNPMTTSGDLILGGSSGAAGRLGIGSSGQVLTVSGGTAVWAASASGFANPMTTTGDLIIGGSGGTAGRLAAGTSGYVLTSTGASSAPTWQAAGGGGSVTGFTTSLNTTSPNNTINASVLEASGGSASQDVVINPKGASSAVILGPAPDSAAAGGNKRGAGAVDLQINRASASQVASGVDSIILAGVSNTASGTNAVASGNATRATADNSAAFGDASRATAAAALSMGKSTQATGEASLSLGSQSSTRGTANAVALGAGAASGLADRQGRIIPFQASTTTATPEEMTSDGQTAGAGNRIAIPNYGAFKIRIEIVAYDLNSDDCKSWEIKALAKQVTGTASAFVGTPSVTVEFGDTGASAWTVAVSISGTVIRIQVTGAASTSIKWTAMAYLCEATT